MNQQEYQLKKMALAIKGLFVGLFGTAAVVFAFAALIYSSNPVTASNPNTGYGTGKYMMEFTSFWDGEKSHWYILAWDSETGRSKMYYGTSKLGKITSAGGDYNLPSSPL